MHSAAAGLILAAVTASASPDVPTASASQSEAQTVSEVAAVSGATFNLSEVRAMHFREDTGVEGVSRLEASTTIGPDDFVYLRHLAELSPETKVYSNLSPSMLYYEGDDVSIDVTIGKDAAYYHEQAAHLHWDEDIQPFGYAGVVSLLNRLEEVLLERKKR